MFRNGPLPTSIHGLLDYALGAFLIAGPFVLNFDKPSATTISIILGLMVLAFAALSDLPTGFVKRIPEAAHVICDLGLGLLLIAAPFMFGFNEASRPTIVLLILGVLQLLSTFSTRFRERKPSKAD